ncbi:bifunctional glutamate N-acetyltransferase/amino-acid acetyltransferase ArgJ [Pinisolibacter aquiterrae]|uniref:bifunctional glutamate N-acetyltransferase/amino-acid acetyltransferase ArgJ n=1 Tax=Pinisolibacter aquiterrae TaxID=2815579 RepID=UPI001C3D5966|nr:bifunctional glutamate N-acetyltransferase/amino-acid acetyltransferase ArgJ [Pinisolibacter aquiterrae]MBV5262781.1 bifunctional glutamate N-acetyltransferase/amino-acid acetyltransferase ArgJ [Pinisolibacter aquiterrae]MCC8233317.1 bifunctional glutamate N-acetyltransferase/amino-acid acetyltransferase ArgJ [Pinisolibacter aquiterrae]
MSHAVSPLAPKTQPLLPAIAGVRFATAEAGIKYKNRTDVLLAVFDEGTTVAGVFTTSKCPSAPVDWCRAHLAGGSARALVVNSGNANAFTGKKGIETVRVTADIAAAAVGCAPSAVFLASTGVIGEPLDPQKFQGVLEETAARVAAEPYLDAAKAIMTTDTFPKVATRTITLDGVSVAINGIAKGAGMIAPDMATMLSFLFTDLPIAPTVLQGLVSRGVVDSYNALTIDGDTSTSDTVLAFATGRAADRGLAPITSDGDPRLGAVAEALDAVMLDLARLVARDGEGARKFVSVTVEGAVSKVSARRIALSIANSPLVKTAIAGEDANWGRVVMAVGKAGEPADRDRLAIWFGDVRVAVEGERDPAYSEAAASAHMKNDEIAIRVEIGLGEGRDTVYTCDLTKEYVAINGDYRS